MLAPKLSFAHSFTGECEQTERRRRFSDGGSPIFELKPLCYRWVTLLIFSLLSASNAILWITFAPIQSDAMAYYGCSSGAVNGLSIVFLALYFPGSIISAFLMRRYGLRGSLVVGACLNFISGCVRYGSVYADLGRCDNCGELSLIILYLGQSIGALGQPLFTNFPAVIAFEWFPVRERDIATIIAALANMLGNAVGQAIPPIFVQNHGGYDSTDSGLKKLLLAELLLVGVGMLLAVLFLRDRPYHLVPSKAVSKQLKAQRQASREGVYSTPTTFQPPELDTSWEVADSIPKQDFGPPSAAPTDASVLDEPAPAAAVAQLDEVIQHWKSLLCDSEFRKLCLGFGLGLGLFNTIMTEIEELVRTAGYSSDQSGTFGAVLIGSGCLGSAFIGPLLDRTQAYKLILRAGFCCATVLMSVMLMYLRPGNMLELSLCFGALGFCMVPLLPVSLEAAAECTYPISAESSSGLLMLMGQLVGIPLIFVIDWLINKSGTRHEGAPIEDTVTAVSIFIVSVMLCCVMAIMMFDGKLARRCVENEEDSFNEDVHESPFRRETTASETSDMLNPLNPGSHGSPSSADSPGSNGADLE